MGKMFFDILATFAEFEADLIRLRTREGMAIARARGKLRGKRPKGTVLLCGSSSQLIFPGDTGPFLSDHGSLRGRHRAAA
jgi:hypothetical protein